MKKLFLLVLISLTIPIFARTQGESKSNLESFAKSHTSSSSSSKDDDDDDDDNDNDDNDNDKDWTTDSDYGVGKDGPFSAMWFWNSIPKKEFNVIQKENKLFYFGTSYNYQHWTPTGINNAKTDTTELNFAKVELSLLFNAIYFSYESSFYGANLNNQRELLEIRQNNQHGWERFLGEIIFPVIIAIDNKPFAKIYLGYDEQVFISTITSLEKKYYSPREDANKGNNYELIDIEPGDKIVTSTLFQDWYLGLKVDFHPIIKENVGLFFLKYNKPYSLTIDDQQYDEEIHDTDFSAIGLYLDLIVDYKMFYIRTGFKIGSGSVKFVAIDTTVSDLVDNSYNTMYFQFNGDIGLTHNITKSIKLEALLKTEYRNFYLNKTDTNEDDDIDDSETLNLNSDFIFTFYAGVSYSF